jgi:uncharacterized protein YjiS (DUF1127 family)
MAITMNTVTATPTSDGRRTISRIKRALGDSMRALQYSRMAHEITKLSEPQLRSIGLTRDEILRNARNSIYGAYD